MNSVQDGRWIGLFIVFLLGLLVLFPLLGTGFTTNDDAYYAFHAAAPWKAMFATMHEEAVYQGRFYKYFFFLLLIGPHLAYSPPVAIAINIVAISANVFLAALLVGRLLAPRLGLLFALLFLALLQDHWGHSLLTSYPLSRQMGLLSCLLCWHSLILWRRTQRQRWLAVSLALYFFALCCNEFFLLFIPLHLLLCAMLRCETAEGKGAGQRSGILVTGFSFGCVALSYVALYLGYRKIFPSAYSGTEASLTDFKAYWSVLREFSLSSLPLSVFFKERLALSRYAPYFSMDASALLLDRLQYQLANYRQWDPSWLARALLAGCGFVFLLWRAPLRISRRMVFCFGLFGLLLLFLPNALLGLTEKYRQWVREGVYAYVFTYHSYYGVCLLLTLFAACCNALLAKWRRVRAVALFALALLFALAAFLTAYANDSIVRTKHLAAQRWELADALFDSAAYRNLPDDTRIAAPTLFQCFRILCPPKEYWSAYAAQRTGKDIEILDHLPDQANPGQGPLYFLELYQAFNTSSQFLTLADVSALGTGNTVLSSQVRLFIKTRARKVRILCPVRPGAPPPALRQHPMRQIACGLFVAELTLDSAADITMVTLLGREIMAEEVIVSEQFPYPALR